MGIYIKVSKSLYILDTHKKMRYDEEDVGEDDPVDEEPAENEENEDEEY